MAISCARCEPSRSGETPIDIAYQPIFNIRSWTAHGYEALVRGPHGEGAASVLNAIGKAERHSFDQRVRVMAIEKAAVLGLVASGASLSINILPSAVIDAERCLGNTLAAAARVGLDPRRIVFELTEGARFDASRTRALVETYRALGFRTALDDFGNGYANLLTLADIPTDFVKLDIGLIRNIDVSRERQTIVHGFAAIAESLGRRVVAEGVETAAELAAIRALGIELVQGFHLGRPSLTELQREPYALAQAA